MKMQTVLVETSQNRIAYPLEEVGTLIGASRSHVRNLINRGELVARKSGRRTLVLKQDLEAYLQKLPTI